MDEFKEQISEDILNTLTMEDLWENPNLRKFIQEKYPSMGRIISICNPNK